MDAADLALELVATLPRGRPGLFNPWADVCADDLPTNGPAAKQQRLARHLDCDARFILCDEAPGWQGMRHTGLAFTSERLVVDGVVPRLNEQGTRLTSREGPFAEPSATIVWRSVFALQIADQVVMWNAVPLHPFVPGAPRTNRTPTEAELSLGKEALRILTGAFPKAAVIAVGKKAAEQLDRLGIEPAAAVRHPANGGARAFAQGLQAYVQARRST